MRVVVLGLMGWVRDPIMSRGTMVPGVSGWNTVYLYSPWGLYLMVGGVI